MLALMRQAQPAQTRFVLIVTVVCLVFAWAVTRTEPARRARLQSLDWRTRLRTHFQPPPDPRIAIVLFDDDSETRIGAWPLDRQWHADFMRLLYQLSPAVISWDIIFDAKGKSADGDEAMGAIAGALAESGVPVLSAGVTNNDSTALPRTAASGPTEPIGHFHGDLAALEGHDRAFLPYAALRNNASFAFADAPPDLDGVRRELPLVVRYGDKAYPSLGLQTALSLLHVRTADVTVTLGDAITFSSDGKPWRIPISSRGTLWLNYRYDQSERHADFPTYSYGKLMVGLDRHFAQGVASEAVPDLKGKAVLIGQTVTGKADAGPTPLGRLSPYTLYHANVVNNILRGDYVRLPSDWLFWPAFGVLTLVLFAAASRRSAWWLLAVSFGGAALYLAAAVVAWVVSSLWLPLIGPLLGFLLVSATIVSRRVRDEQKAKEHIRQMFGSYLSPDLLARMVSQGSSLQVRSERRPVAILFSDLRDFTAWSERTPEDVLISQLNEYLAAMVDCLHAEQGTLHKFIGDAVMAVWGDLSDMPPAESAERACRAALRMQARLSELNNDWLARGLHTLRMGIGINHGQVLIGNIGSPKRMEFTAIGDPVNLASRLESMNKTLQSSILVGEAVHALAADRFVFVPRGSLPIKGKAEPVAIFELAGAARPGSDRL